jgi:hypothetical protein
VIVYCRLSGALEKMGLVMLLTIADTKEAVWPRTKLSFGLLTHGRINLKSHQLSGAVGKRSECCEATDLPK